MRWINTPHNFEHLNDELDRIKDYRAAVLEWKDEDTGELRHCYVKIPDDATEGTVLGFSAGDVPTSGYNAGDGLSLTIDSGTGIFAAKLNTKALVFDDDKNIDVNIATRDQLGVVQIGNGIDVDDDGVISVASAIIEVNASQVGTSVASLIDWDETVERLNNGVYFIVKLHDDVGHDDGSGTTIYDIDKYLGMVGSDGSSTLVFQDGDTNNQGSVISGTTQIALTRSGDNTQISKTTAEGGAVIYVHDNGTGTADRNTNEIFDMYDAGYLVVFTDGVNIYQMVNATPNQAVFQYVDYSKKDFIASYTATVGDGTGADTTTVVYDEDGCDTLKIFEAEDQPGDPHMAQLLDGKTVKDIYDACLGKNGVMIHLDTGALYNVVESIKEVDPVSGDEIYTIQAAICKRTDDYTMNLMTLDAIEKAGTNEFFTVKSALFQKVAGNLITAHHPSETDTGRVVDGTYDAIVAEANTDPRSASDPESRGFSEISKGAVLCVEGSQLWYTGITHDVKKIVIHSYGVAPVIVSGPNAGASVEYVVERDDIANHIRLHLIYDYTEQKWYNTDKTVILSRDNSNNIWIYNNGVSSYSIEADINVHDIADIDVSSVTYAGFVGEDLVTHEKIIGKIYPDDTVAIERCVNNDVFLNGNSVADYNHDLEIRLNTGDGLQSVANEINELDKFGNPLQNVIEVKLKDDVPSEFDGCWKTYINHGPEFTYTFSETTRRWECNDGEYSDYFGKGSYIYYNFAEGRWHHVYTSGEDVEYFVAEKDAVQISYSAEAVESEGKITSSRYSGLEVDENGLGIKLDNITYPNTKDDVRHTYLNTAKSWQISANTGTESDSFKYVFDALDLKWVCTEFDDDTFEDSYMIHDGVDFRLIVGDDVYYKTASLTDSIVKFENVGKYINFDFYADSEKYVFTDLVPDSGLIISENGTRVNIHPDMGIQVDEKGIRINTDNLSKVNDGYVLTYENDDAGERVTWTKPSAESEIKIGDGLKFDEIETDKIEVDLVEGESTGPAVWQIIQLWSNNGGWPWGSYEVDKSTVKDSGEIYWNCYTTSGPPPAPVAVDDKLCYNQDTGIWKYIRSSGEILEIGSYAVDAEIMNCPITITGTGGNLDSTFKAMTYAPKYKNPEVYSGLNVDSAGLRIKPNEVYTVDTEQQYYNLKNYYDRAPMQFVSDSGSVFILNPSLQEYRCEGGDDIIIGDAKLWADHSSVMITDSENNLWKYSGDLKTSSTITLTNYSGLPDITISDAGEGMFIYTSHTYTDGSPDNRNHGFVVNQDGIRVELDPRSQLVYTPRGIGFDTQNMDRTLHDGYTLTYTEEGKIAWMPPKQSVKDITINDISIIEDKKANILTGAGIKQNDTEIGKLEIRLDNSESTGDYIGVCNRFVMGYSPETITWDFDIAQEKWIYTGTETDFELPGSYIYFDADRNVWHLYRVRDGGVDLPTTDGLYAEVLDDGGPAPEEAVYWDSKRNKFEGCSSGLSVFEYNEDTGTGGLKVAVNKKFGIDTDVTGIKINTEGMDDTKDGYVLSYKNDVDGERVEWTESKSVEPGLGLQFSKTEANEIDVKLTDDVDLAYKGIWKQYKYPYKAGGGDAIFDFDDSIGKWICASGGSGVTPGATLYFEEQTDGTYKWFCTNVMGPLYTIGIYPKDNKTFDDGGGFQATEAEGKIGEEYSGLDVSEAGLKVKLDNITYPDTTSDIRHEYSGCAIKWTGSSVKSEGSSKSIQYIFDEFNLKWICTETLDTHFSNSYITYDGSNWVLTINEDTYSINDSITSYHLQFTSIPDYVYLDIYREGETYAFTDLEPNSGLLISEAGTRVNVNSNLGIQVDKNGIRVNTDNLDAINDGYVLTYKNDGTDEKVTWAKGSNVDNVSINDVSIVEDGVANIITGDGLQVNEDEENKVEIKLADGVEGEGIVWKKYEEWSSAGAKTTGYLTYNSTTHKWDYTKGTSGAYNVGSELWFDESVSKWYFTPGGAGASPYECTGTGKDAEIVSFMGSSEFKAVASEGKTGGEISYSGLDVSEDGLKIKLTDEPEPDEWDGVWKRYYVNRGGGSAEGIYDFDEATHKWLPTKQSGNFNPTALIEYKMLEGNWYFYPGGSSGTAVLAASGDKDLESWSWAGTPFTADTSMGKRSAELDYCGLAIYESGLSVKLDKKTYPDSATDIHSNYKDVRLTWENTTEGIRFDFNPVTLRWEYTGTGDMFDKDSYIEYPNYPSSISGVLYNNVTGETYTTNNHPNYESTLNFTTSSGASLGIPFYNTDNKRYSPAKYATGAGLVSTEKGLRVKVNPNLGISMDSEGVKLNTDYMTDFHDGYILTYKNDGTNEKVIWTKPTEPGIAIEAGDGLQFNATEPNKLEVKLEEDSGLKLSSDGLTVELSSDGNLEYDYSSFSTGLKVRLSSNGGLETDHINGGIKVALLADSGLQCSSNRISTKLNANGGLQCNTDGISIKLNPYTNTGLTLDSSGLMVRVNNTGGMAIGSSGLEVKYDNTSIGLDASGRLETKTKIYSGTSEPSSTLGKDGDIYILFEDA